MIIKILKSFFISTTLCVTVIAFAPLTHATDTRAAGLTPIIMLLLDDDNEEIDMASASRFLMQATYGPTLDEITALTNSSYEKWIDNQFSLPATNHIEYGLEIGHFRPGGTIFQGPVPGRTQRYSVWNHIAMNAPDQLRQRMAFALSQIFVVSDRAVSSHSIATGYYDLLVDNAFVSYRELLEKVALNQFMGRFLGMAGNQRANPDLNIIRPDENFAREIMQLFSIGLVELELDGTPKLDANGNQIPTYAQSDVEELAKVFTGWHLEFISDATFDQTNRGLDNRYLGPMRAFANFHDVSSKTLLSVPGFNSVIPPNQTAEQELEQTLDILANHPNTAPFISKQLIQRFVTSNPTPAYVRRISTVFNETDGDLQAVIKAILLDAEARQGHLRNPETFGKIKEPILKLTGFWRGVGLLLNVPLAGPSSIRFEQMEQTPLSAPSVFNFFRPDFSPSGVLSQNGLFSPESQLLTSTSIVTMGSTLTDFSLISNQSQNPNSATFTAIATDHLELLVPDDLVRPEALVEHLNIVLLAGSMTDEMREILLNLHSGSDGYAALNKLNVVNDILYLITLSPDFNVQR